MIKNRRAFTLVELLVVMSIILILVGLAIPAVNIARMKAKDTEVKAGCTQIQAALEQHAVDHGGLYPGAHWAEDRSGNWYVGPGVLGGLPSYDGGTPNKDFHVPNMETPDAVGPFNQQALMADGTPNPNVIDKLVVESYLTEYPANPFLRATGSARSQMSNLFLFNPVLGDRIPDPNPSFRYTLDFNRYTNDGATSESMRSAYIDYGRGHFTYIPINPVNNSGIDWVAEWNNGVYSDRDRSEYYKGCRGYILVGWGNNRLNDTEAKGISDVFWTRDLSSGNAWFDFDRSQTPCQMEWALSNGAANGLLYNEMRDSNNDVGAFGSTNVGGGINIDAAFFGAVYFKVSGS